MFGKKSQHKGELMIPPIASADSSGKEVLRAWVADNSFHVSLRPEVWDDSAAWGVAIADIIRHLADAYYATKGSDREETIGRVLSLLHAELDAPTDTPTGYFAD